MGDQVHDVPRQLLPLCKDSTKMLRTKFPDFNYCLFCAAKLFVHHFHTERRTSFIKHWAIDVDFLLLKEDLRFISSPTFFFLMLGFYFHSYMGFPCLLSAVFRLSKQNEAYSICLATGLLVLPWKQGIEL